MPYSFSLFYVWLDFVFHQTVWWIKQKKENELAAAGYPHPGSHSFAIFITCLGLRVLFCSEILQSLSANTWTPRSLVLTVLLAVYRCFALVTLKRVLVRTNQFGKFFPSSLSPFPVSCFNSPVPTVNTWCWTGHQGSFLWANVWASAFTQWPFSQFRIYVYTWTRICKMPAVSPSSL